MLHHALWSLASISDGNNDNIEAVIHASVTFDLVRLLRHKQSFVQLPALRTIGNLISGNKSEHTALVLETNTCHDGRDCTALPALRALLKKRTLQEDACWTLSNIVLDGPRYIQAVIDAKIMPPVISLLNDDDAPTVKEATWYAITT